MLDEDLKEDELSDNEEPPVVPEVEQEEVQPTNISNKLVNFIVLLFIEKLQFYRIFFCSNDSVIYQCRLYFKFIRLPL